MPSNETVLEPDLPIIDPHHHLWDRPGSRYLVDNLKKDLATGHNIQATVYVQCRSMYRSEEPDYLKPVGEVEFVVAETSACGQGQPGPALCRAITGHADLLGPKVDEVLEALVSAGKGRLRGIRHIAAYDHDNIFGSVRAKPGMLLNPTFRQGYSRLRVFGLLFEAWLYHPQLQDLIDLARSAPETTIILNHVGAPLGSGTYRDRRREVFEEWSKRIRILAACPNVVVKLGWFGMPLMGFGFEKQDRRPGYHALAASWTPYIELCIDAFGVQRCMFESNFPVDKVSCNYADLWNAFKHIARHASADEKAALFSGTARQVYRI